MALDPNLIYGIRLPEVEAYGAASGNAMRLRNMYQDNQAQAQRTQAGKMQLDQAQREKLETDAYNELIAQHTTNGATNFKNVGASMIERGYGAKGAGIVAQA